MTKKEEQTFLVLLQNSAELRPTGGFIGSYAILRFRNAKLEDLAVEDVYVADGQLKGHVEPPPPIKKYLGEAGWYLRDANWDADFPTAARQIEWFFEKETGMKIDGTIALNLFVAQDLLSALGPVELRDYKEKITAENLFETAQRYSELNTFPGTTQKKDFLDSLARSLFLNLEKADIQTLAQAAKALHASLEKGQLLVAVHDEDAQRILNERGWDGSLKETSCEPGEQNLPCLEIFLAIREANVGVNKANYFIKRAIAISRKVQEERTETTLAIRYQNQSPENAWPGGQYKNYLRLYFERNGKPVSVKVDGKELKTTDVEVKAEHGKMVIGFLLTVPVQAEKLVEIRLESKGLKFEGGKSREVLLVQKQPGTQDDPITIEVVPAKGIEIRNASLPLTITDHTGVLTQTLSSDLKLEIDFRKIQ